MTEQKDDTWLDVEQCAKKVGVSTVTIRRLIADKELKATQIGSQWRIRPSDWQDYIDRHSNIRD